MNNDAEVYAVPGSGGIIDMINTETGLTGINGETEAQVRVRYPNAVRMTWEAFQADQRTRQQTPITWEPTTAKEYDAMLGVLPPAMWQGGAFLVGEPMDHCYATGAPRFTAYRQQGTVYTVASRPITRTELRAILSQ